MEAPPPMESLPIDLQLEIAAHSGDAATILRCAAASKALRAAVHGPGFRPRRRAALSAAVRAGFDPAHLLGVSGASSNPSSTSSIVFEDKASMSKRPRLDADLLRSFEPVSSRGGLLVLWRPDPEPELRVCNTSTGLFSSLPCMDVEGKWGSGGIYSPAVLSVGRFFELLVMDVCFRARVFFSRRGRWSAIRVVRPPPEHDSWCAIDHAMGTSPAVVGSTAHWICRSKRSAGVFILALHAAAAQATAIALPPLLGCLVGTTASCSLTDTAESLGMVVSETDVISMWKLSTEGWSREVVISKLQVTSGMDDADWTACWCVGFRESTGDLLLWMERIGLVKLNIGA